jgi:hypothetical protein
MCHDGAPDNGSIGLNQYCFLQKSAFFSTRTADETNEAADAGQWALTKLALGNHAYDTQSDWLPPRIKYPSSLSPA